MGLLGRIVEAALPGRLTEATPEQLVATGALGAYGFDPVDGDRGYSPLGASPRDLPAWTLLKARADSIAAYRYNPMARAVIDTYTAFCVGDSGVSPQASNDRVREVVDAHWNDPYNTLGARQEMELRDLLLMGEQVWEPMVGEVSGAVRWSFIDPIRITQVHLLAGNPLWHGAVDVADGMGSTVPRTVVHADDLTGLLTGDVLFWPEFRTLITDRRGMPFLTAVIDDLDAYDTVLSNLVDRTALQRYLAFDVTIAGAGYAEIEEFVKKRGGVHPPPSGGIEVHNDKVVWKPMTAETRAQEDTATAKAILTNVAGGSGLSRHWLADPEDANRATSLSMAEPVRRRVGGVQKMFLARQAERLRYAVDRAVAAGRLPRMVETTDETGVTGRMVPASQTVSVTGPEIAAADAQITAEILVNLSKGLTEMVAGEILTAEAATVAAKKAWEQFVGIPYTADLDKPDGSAKDDLAQVLDDPNTQVTFRLA